MIIPGYCNFKLKRLWCSILFWIFTTSGRYYPMRCRIFYQAVFWCRASKDC